MKKVKLNPLEVIFTINALLLMGIGIFILIKGFENRRVFIILMGFVPILLGVITIGYSFFIINEMDKPSLRTCEPGTIVKLWSDKLFKFRGIMIDQCFSLYDENHQKHYLYFDFMARRFAFLLSPKHYLINSIDNITDLLYETITEANICQKIKVSIKGIEFNQTLNLLKQPLKVTSNPYLEKIKEVELLKTIFTQES